MDTQLIAFGFSFTIFWGTHVGLGRHEVDVKPEWHSSLKKAEYGFSVLYVRRPSSIKGALSMS